MRVWQSPCFDGCQTLNDQKLLQDVDETSNRGCTQATHSVLMFCRPRTDWDGRSLLWLSGLREDLWRRVLSALSAFYLLPLVVCPTHRLSFLLLWAHLPSEEHIQTHPVEVQRSLLLSEFSSIPSTVYGVPTMFQALGWTLGNTYINKPDKKNLPWWSLHYSSGHTV